MAIQQRVTVRLHGTQDLVRRADVEVSDFGTELSQQLGFLAELGLRKTTTGACGTTSTCKMVVVMMLP